MKITLKRLKMSPKKTYTIGHLYIDGKYYCDTIEDIDRGLTQDMPLSEIMRKKVKHLTAIPKGTYQVTLKVKAPKFSIKPYYKNFCDGYVPRLLEVPGFDGILMHKGTTEKDSSGCLILGLNKKAGSVSNSQECFEKVYNKLKTAKDKITITIE